jgi:hypothetical protein
MDLITQNAKTGWKRPIYFTSVSGYDFFDVFFPFRFHRNLMLAKLKEWVMSNLPHFKLD